MAFCLHEGRAPIKGSNKQKRKAMRHFSSLQDIVLNAFKNRKVE
ncbi:hypothetical protein [Bartonella silvatica]